MTEIWLDNYTVKSLIDEIKKKQKVKLSLKQQDEIDDYYNDYKKELTTLKEQIEATDRKIDRMVYELYELTEDEIGIVEGEK